MQKKYVYAVALSLYRCKRLLYAALVFLMLLNGAICFSQVTYTWNKTGIADWTVDVNWTPARTAPAANDILLFNSGAATTLINVPSQTIGQLSVGNNTAVNLQSGATGNTLTIAGLTGSDDLAIANGSSFNINGTNATTIFLGTGATANIQGSINYAGCRVQW
jgi:hypothetical protein